jgi:hypothetical protein
MVGWGGVLQTCSIHSSIWCCLCGSGVAGPASYSSLFSLPLQPHVAYRAQCCRFLQVP